MPGIDILTIKCERHRVSKVDDRWECFDAVAFGQWRVDYADQTDPEGVQLVVNLFQLSQDLVTRPTVWLNYILVKTENEAFLIFSRPQN